MHKVPAESALDAFRLYCAACAFLESQKSIQVSAPNENVSRDVKRAETGWPEGRERMPAPTQELHKNESGEPPWWIDDVEDVPSDEIIERYQGYLRSVSSENESF